MRNIKSLEPPGLSGPLKFFSCSESPYSLGNLPRRLVCFSLTPLTRRLECRGYFDRGTQVSLSTLSAGIVAGSALDDSGILIRDECGLEAVIVH